MNTIFNFSNIIYLIVLLPVTLLSIMIHECSHGYAAYLCGDNTAKFYGRLTLNPLKHIDWLGAVCLLVFHFGWAKPVPVNFRNLKHFKRDTVIVSLAGPVSNFLFAFILTFIFYCSLRYNFISETLYRILISAISMNIGFGIFNLIPIPPLDGSKILGMLLSEDAAYKLFKIEKYGTIVLFIILFIPFLSRIFTGILGSGINLVYIGYINLIKSIFGLF